MSPGFQNPNATFKVLIVDDDASVLAMAKAILQAAGFPVIPATSGESALAIYSEEFFSGRLISLVLMDLTLPGGMTGLETLDALRQIDSNIRVIASSGYFDESAAQAAKRRGFFGILPKPYSAERLTKVVQWGVGRAA
jgi:CheY-like chemotaxis protein